MNSFRLGIPRDWKSLGEHCGHLGVQWGEHDPELWAGGMRAGYEGCGGCQEIGLRMR